MIRHIVVFECNLCFINLWSGCINVTALTANKWAGWKHISVFMQLLDIYTIKMFIEVIILNSGKYKIIPHSSDIAFFNFIGAN